MSESKIKKGYKEAANFYDDTLTQSNWLSKLYINLFWGVDDTKIAKKVLDFIPDDFSGKLLDIPVGTAVFTYKKYDSLKNAEIICVDYSEDMINKAKERFSKLSNINIICQQGDVGHLSYNDDSFDILLSMNGFHAFPDKNKAFEETARVIKRGGCFIGCFYIKGEKCLTDFVVNAVLSKKGWFTPPFHTKSELKNILVGLYSNVELHSENAMVWFKCLK